LALAAAFVDFGYVVTSAVDPAVESIHVQVWSFLHEAKENAEITAANKNTFFIFIEFFG
jgi:hypothetical protein